MINDTGLSFMGTEEIRNKLVDLAFDRVVFARSVIHTNPEIAADQIDVAIAEFKRLLGKEPATT